MSAQLRILRVFRWVAIFTIFVAINAAGLDCLLFFDKGTWLSYTEGETISNVILLLESHFYSVLLAVLVWITSTLAEKFLKTTVDDGRRG